MRAPLLIVFFLTFAANMAGAQTEIYKCKSADGGVMYSQIPCKDEVPAEAEEPVASEPVEELAPMTDIMEMPPLDMPETDAPTSEERAACQKRYRDEIDEIDAELRRETSRERDDEYKQRLLALTRKLREC